MHYILYFPGVENKSRIPATFDLASIERDGAMHWQPVAAGPDGRSGLLGYWVGVTEAHARGSVFPGQAWRESPDQLFWLGWDDPARPPSPLDLARPRQRAGSLVRLLDGNSWRIPRAKALPHVLALNADRQEVRRPAPEFAHYCAQCYGVLHALADWILSGAEVDFRIAMSVGLAAEALAINYRLNVDLVSLLGLVDDLAFQAIVQAAVEIDDIREVEAHRAIEKKNVADSSPERLACSVAGSGTAPGAAG